MSGGPLPTTIDMPCLLLEKLAPETRTIIYEYALSFATPIKHVKKLQPFLKKLTSAEQRSSSQTIEGEAEESAMEELEVPAETLKRVNTSILTANKLIYLEAIAVFYANNALSIDPTSFGPNELASPHSTDLSLATHVITECDTLGEKDGDTAINMFNDSWNLVILTFPAIFPNLRKSSVHVYTDLPILFSQHMLMPKYSALENMHFNGVGSTKATSKKQHCLEFCVSHEAITEAWEMRVTDNPTLPIDPRTVSAHLLYRASRTDQENAHAKFAFWLFQMFRSYLLPAKYGAIAQDSYEYWTIVAGAVDLLHNAPS